jgi:prepilin-type processing-associated H-X9-DG protein
MKTSHSPISERARACSHQDQQAGAGFSQVDLLTVIGVLVLLVLLLTPALARTRKTEQAFQCRNNLRQLLHGFQMYADDQSGTLPNCYYWVHGVLDYNANNRDNTNLDYLMNGELGPYLKNPAAYKCPADQGLVREGGVYMPRARNLSMSQAFTDPSKPGAGSYVSNTNRHYSKVADMVLPAPANLWVMVDENPDSVNDAAFAVVMEPYGALWQDGPSVWHEGGCGFAFADGHSMTKKWTDARTMGMSVTYAPFNHGWYQAKNPDIMWLQDHTSAPK